MGLQFRCLFLLLSGLSLLTFSCRQTPYEATTTPVCPQADTLFKASMTQYEAGQLDVALHLARRSAQAANAAGCGLKWAKARVEVARIIRLSDKEHGGAKAIDTLLTDLKIAGQAYPQTRGLFYFHLGYAHRKREDFVGARPYYEQAMLLHETVGNVVPKRSGQFLYKVLGEIYVRLGEHTKGVNILHIALDSAWAQRDTPAVAAISNGLGLAYWDVKEWKPAVQHFQEGLRCAGLPVEVSSELLANWATCLHEMEKPDSARLLATRARELDPSNVTALTVLGEVEMTQGEWLAADHHFQQAESSMEQEPLPNRELGKVILERVRLAKRQEAKYLDVTGLLRRCNEAMHTVLPSFKGSAADDTPVPTQLYAENTLLEALDLKSQILWEQSQGHPDDEALLKLADTTTALALRMHEVLLDVYSFESSKLISLENVRALQERQLQILFAAHRRKPDPVIEARVVAFFEKSRALLLRQKLAGEQALLTTLSPESRKQEERLRGEEIYQKNLLAELEAEEASAAEIEQQRRLIFKAEDARRQFSQQLAANQPAFAHALQAYPTVTLEEVRKRLIRSDTTLLIEYFYNPEQGTLYLAGLTSNALYLSITALDAGEIGAFLGLLKNREINLQMETDHDFRWKFARQARLLYDALLKPVIPAQLPRELIIVPDGTLGAIPFDLLLPRDVDDHTDSFQTMPYLLRQTRVHFAASATLLLHASPLTEVQQATIGYLGFCPDYLPGGFFDVVHHGRPCVRRLAELFQGEFLSGSAATSADFLEQAAHTQILHFYGHAKAEDDRPEQSYLAFSSRTDRDKKATAGLIPAKPGKSLGPKSKLPADVVPDVIFAQQVSLMHLPAQLTVLSGCETGIGLTAGGEGIFSLARAFQEAGCPSTAMTLWTVDDEATAWLTTRFLQYIKNGAAKDEALRRAKLDFLASSATPAPYFWSGLVLSGDARPLTGLKTGSYLSLPDRRLPLIDVLMAVGLMLVIFGLLFAIFRHGSPSNRQI